MSLELGLPVMKLVRRRKEPTEPVGLSRLLMTVENLESGVELWA
jgi:hypothetical protein